VKGAACGLLKIQDAKMAKIRHLGTIAHFLGYIFAIKACIANRKEIC